MTIDHDTKTITYKPCELHMVANYIKYCTMPGERKQWTLKQETTKFQYGRRNKKTESQGI